MPKTPSFTIHEVPTTRISYSPRDSGDRRNIPLKCRPQELFETGKWENTVTAFFRIGYCAAQKLERSNRMVTASGLASRMVTANGSSSSHLGGLLVATSGGGSSSHSVRHDGGIKRRHVSLGLSLGGRKRAENIMLLWRVFKKPHSLTGY